MRRLAPRPLRVALEAAAQDAAPTGVLAGLQAAWGDLAGPVVAGECAPVSEREGVVTVACASAVWAQELELLAPDLIAHAHARLGAGQLRGLRFVVSRRGGP